MTDDRLQLSASVDLTAAADSEKPAKISILGYTGGPMVTAGYGAVLIDLGGVELPSVVPILTDHESTISATAGSASPRTDGKTLVLDGTLSRASAAGAAIIALSKDAVPLQASIGLQVLASKFLQEGETVTANGQTLQVPANGLRLVTKSRLREISVVPIGADDQTTVQVKASSQKVPPMTTEATTTPSDLQSEKTRIADINAKALELMRSHPHASEKIEAAAESAIQTGVDANAAKVALYDAVQVDLAQFGSRHARRDGGNTQQVLEASLMIRAGFESAAVKHFGEQVTQAARKSRLGSLVDLCRASLRAGMIDPAGFDTDEQMIRAAFSTATIPNILSSVTGRVLTEAYSETTDTWRPFAYVASAENFKPQQGIRPAAIQNLEEVGGGGEIKHGSLGEEALYPWNVKQFAKMIGVTRKQIIDDDLGFVEQLAPMLGRAAGRSLADLIWQTILSGQNAGFFATANGNLAEAGSALDVTALGAAVQAMRSQRDSQGYDLAISPQVLAVGPSLELTARRLLNSAEVVGPSDQLTPNGNPVSGIVPTLVVESRIENTERFTGASSTQWFLFGGPTTRPVTVGFLRGRQQPTVEIEPAPFDRLGIQMRVVFDYGCALSDPKAAYKATGAPGEGG